MNKYLPLLYQLVLVLFIIVAYHNTLNSPFLFDDGKNIVQNQYIQIDSLNVTSLKKVFSELQPMKTRPVAYFSFSLNYLTGGFDPFGFHVTNILIHIITSLILIRLVNWYAQHEEWPINNKLLFSFAVVMVWAVNPIQTTSITYIVQRMTSLCTLFFASSLLSYLAARDLFIQQEKIKSQAKSIFLLFIAFLLWIMAMLTKEIAAILPVIIILHELFFYDDLSWKKIVQKKNKYLFSVLGLLILCLLYWHSTLSFESILNGYALRDFTLEERLLTQSRAVIRYMTLFLWPFPSRLTLYYDYQVSRSLIYPISTIFSISAILIIVSGSCALAKKYKLISFGLLWTILCLVIESSFLPLELIFEHRFYLPSIGFSLAIVACFFRCFGTRVQNRNIVFLSLFTVICFLTWGTYKRNSDFESEILFSLDAVRKTPEQIRALNNLASAYIHTGDMENGRIVLERAIKLKPDDLLILSNLYGLCVDIGKKRKSEFYLQRLKKSIKNGNFNCNSKSSLYMVAEMLFQKGRFGEAILMLEPLRNCNQDTIYFDNLAICYLQTGNYNQAIRDFKNALKLDPQNSLVMYSLAKAYFLANDEENAINILNTMKNSNPTVELLQQIKILEHRVYE